MAIFIGRNITDESKAWLRERQVDYVEQPLINIQLNEPDSAFFQKIAKHTKNWIITSNWAAIWLQQHYKTIGFKRIDVVFCLSEKQATTIREFSNAVFVSKEKSLNSLSELLKQEKTHKLCICLKGNRSLKASGLEIIEVEVYENILIKPFVENEFDAYLFFSPSGIESFIQGGNSIPADSKIITIGETTARKAKEEFATEVQVSTVQSELATIQKAVSVLKEKEINLD